MLSPRASPLKRRCTVVDAVPMPTPAPLRGPIRARAEERLLIVGAREKSRPAAGRQMVMSNGDGVWSCEDVTTSS